MANAMQVTASVSWLPKRGHLEAEYEDAYWARTAALDAGGFRCAIADGASEASFSRPWARVLARAYWQGRLRHDRFADDLRELRRRWQQMADRRHQGLPWFAQHKARLGAFASLLGLTLHAQHKAAGGSQWQALAVGDSNLFLVRDGALIIAFPLVRVAQFERGPFLICSRPDADARALTRAVAHARGDWRPGDAFYLLTDALACWFLGRHERGGQPWTTLDAVATAADPHAAFAELVGGLRDRGELLNDDVTLVRVGVDPVAAAAAADAIDDGGLEVESGSGRRCCWWEHDSGVGDGRQDR